MIRNRIIFVTILWQVLTINIKAMNSDFDLELGTHQRQIDSLTRYVDTLIERIQKVDNLEHPD